MFPFCCRLVPGKIPFTAYVICLVEFAERASYYGLVFPEHPSRALD
jgi:dipeptide/tripeptide permease